MEKGYSKKVDLLFRYLEDSETRNISDYIDRISDNFIEYKDISEINVSNYRFLNSDISSIKNYSGYVYQYINDALNGRWDYSYDGGEDFRKHCLELGDDISKILLTKHFNCDNNFKTFRGVNISTFNEYGIYDINELVNLKGKYLFDYGFISTSFLEKTSYFKKEVPEGLIRNVLIEYNIGNDFGEGVYLENDNFSYCSCQNEFVINTESLAYVDNVILNDDGTAILKVYLIPKKVYRKDYRDLVEKNEKNNVH